MKMWGYRPWTVGDIVLRYPHTGDGNVDGTGDDDSPDDSSNPPTGPQRRTKPPVQTFSQADLDSAASTARGEERERIKGKHQRDIDAKDAEITDLKEQVERLNLTIAGYEQSLREEFVQIQENLPEWIKTFAPAEDAPASEIRAFVVRARQALAQYSGNPTPTERDLYPDPTRPTDPLLPTQAPPVPPSPPPAPVPPQGPITITQEIEERRRTGGRRF